jgi:hypothetical protein
MKTLEEILKERGIIEYDSRTNGAVHEYAMQYAPKWAKISDSKPLCYKAGGWTGERSDWFVGKDDTGRLYVLEAYEGSVGGRYFFECYDSEGWEREGIVEWTKLI